MRQLVLALTLSLLACAVDDGEVAVAPPVDWPAILAPTRARWPAPQESVVWRNDLDAALSEARASGRPVFVTLRWPELDPLLAQFITVRLVSMRGPGVSRLPYQGFQDLDLSWWGYFLDADGLLGIYGGKDEVSDATRISVPSLATKMRRVLDHHYDPRRPTWTVTPGRDVREPGRVASLEGCARGTRLLPQGLFGSSGGCGVARGPGDRRGERRASRGRRAGVHRVVPPPFRAG